MNTDADPVDIMLELPWLLHKVQSIECWLFLVISAMKVKIFDMLELLFYIAQMNVCYITSGLKGILLL